MAPKLTVVKTLQERIDAAITRVRSGVAFRECDLIREFDLTRGVVKELIKTYAPPGRPIKLRGQGRAVTVPPPLPVPIPLLPLTTAPAPAADPPKPHRARGSTVVAVLSIMVAVIFGGVGMVLNYKFASSFGEGSASLLFGVFGVGIEGAAHLLPSIAGYLADKRTMSSYALGVAAWLVYFVVVLLVALASTGFWATNVGNSLLANDIAIKHRQDLERERSEARADFEKAKKDKPLKDAAVDELDRAIQAARYNIPSSRLQATQDCTPSQVTSSYAFCDPLIQLRGRKPEAQRAADDAAKQLVELPARISRLSDDIAALPAIAAKDPSAEQIGKLTFGIVGAEQVELFRIFASVLVLSFAPGLLLAFVRALLK